jgi:hypothetical protein
MAHSAPSKIRSALQNRRFNELTASELRSAFAGEGIKTVDEVAERIARAVTEFEMHRQTPLSRSVVDHMLRGHGSTDFARWTTRVPLLFERRQLSPADLGKLGYDRLSFVLANNSHGPLLNVFPDLAAAFHFVGIKPQDYGEVPGGGTPGGAGAPYTPGQTGDGGIPNLVPGNSSSAGSSKPLPPPPHTGPTVQCFSETSWNGDWMWCDYGLAWNDLRGVPRGTFLWWHDDWNDAICSLSATNSQMVYWEDINWGGSTLVVPGGSPAIADLGPMGWANRISSMGNYR